MSFKLNLSIFKSTKPDSKIDFSGMMNIKVEELDALCRFVMSQAPDQYGAVQVPISGWKKTAKSGLNYISAVGQPPSRALLDTPWHCLSAPLPPQAPHSLGSSALHASGVLTSSAGVTLQRCSSPLSALLGRR